MHTYVAVSLLCSLYPYHYYKLLDIDVVSMILAVKILEIVMMFLVVKVTLHHGTCKSKFHILL